VSRAGGRPPGGKVKLAGTDELKSIRLLAQHTTLTRPYTLLPTMSDLHQPTPAWCEEKRKRALALAVQLSHTHIYAYSIILQLTVCRNVNTHPQEPLRFTTPRPPPPAPPCYTPGLFTVETSGAALLRRLCRRRSSHSSSCIHSFPFRIRYAIISR
jgi:hypothetical protein